MIELPRRNWNKDKYRPPSQATLNGKTFRQRDIQKTLEMEIENLNYQLAWMKHILTTKIGMIETCMGIERYWARRLPWWFDVCHDISDGDSTCPNPHDYEIGCYGDDLKPGTKKFIRDRIAWARPIVQEELENAEGQLEMCKQMTWGRL